MPKSSIDLVREFHVAFARPVRDTPDVGTPEERVLRVRLMIEEVLEFAKAAGIAVFYGTTSIESILDLTVHAWGEPRLAQMARELADTRYVVDGTAVQLGIPLEACVAEIHAANMRKLGADGKPIVDENRKVRKPEGWVPADVGRTLERLARGEETAEASRTEHAKNCAVQLGTWAECDCADT